MQKISYCWCGHTEHDHHPVPDHDAPCWECDCAGFELEYEDWF